MDWLRIVGPEGTLEVFGVRLIGVSLASGKKLLFTVVWMLVVTILAASLRRILRAAMQRRESPARAFWLRQGVHLVTAFLLLVGLISIWFRDPGRVTAAGGIITAGLAVALQKVITAFAGYAVLLRSGTYRVGDRIAIGTVRGDVLGVGFLQTRILEMGQPPGVQADPPALWVEARQYTGRIVTVSNSQIFDLPVYNYTRGFPYLWEEMKLPISYHSDRHRAEQILLDAAGRHAVSADRMDARSVAEAARRIERRPEEIAPQVYLRLTDNWIELTVRFLVEDHGIREVKDRMSREILDALDRAKIGVASTTFELVGIPALKVEAGGKIAVAPEDGADPGRSGRSDARHGS